MTGLKIQTKLNVVIPTFNRPRLLERALKSALLLGDLDYKVIVIDDGSTKIERLSDGTIGNTLQVINRLDDPRIIYVPKSKNEGLGKVFEDYVDKYASGDYVLFINDDDMFIDPEPLYEAVELMESDPDLAVVYLSLIRRSDDAAIESRIELPYPKMTGQEFFRRYSIDEEIRHTSIYGVFRTKFIAETNALRPIGLQEFGLQDAFGIDTDLVFRLLTKGKVGFVDKPYVLRRETAGLTERFPMSFAYCYYQYIRRAMEYMKTTNFLEPQYGRKFLRSWFKIMLMMCSASMHSPVSEEWGEQRIRQHLRFPLHVYILWQMARYRVWLEPEAWGLFRSTLKLTWQNKSSIPGYFYSPRKRSVQDPLLPKGPDPV